MARAALVFKLSHLSRAGTPLAASAPAAAHRHLRKLTRASCVVYPTHKAVPKVWLCSLQLPQAGTRALQGCLSPCGWQRSQCPLIGILWLAAHLPVPAMHSTSLCSATLLGLVMLTWTMSLRGSYQHCCPQDCVSRHGYQFNLLKICHKEK